MANVHRAITLESALSASAAEVASRFGRHINTPLKSLLTFIGADRRYVRARGLSVFDDTGREYVDFLGGYDHRRHAATVLSTWDTTTRSWPRHSNWSQSGRTYCRHR